MLTRLWDKRSLYIGERMWAIFTKEINKYFKRKEKDPLVQSRLHLRLHIVFQSKLGST